MEKWIIENGGKLLVKKTFAFEFPDKGTIFYFLITINSFSAANLLKMIQKHFQIQN